MKTASKFRINWAQPDICQADFNSLKDCFDSMWISQGKKVKLFEDYIATYSNRKYCIAINSGSSALMAVLIAYNISSNSEVIIPAISFIALPHILTLLGALPVLADVDKNSGIINRETVSPCISNKTSAIIAIDYSGFANDWTDLSVLCRELKIPLIIDSACSFLATNNGRYAGSFGDVAIFSFHSAKPITTGEGGAIVTDNEELASLLTQIRNHGEIHGKKYFYNSLGSNFQMTDIAAAIGISQIRRKDKILKHRSKLISYYLEHNILNDLALVEYKKPNINSNGFTFTILCQARDKVKEDLNKYGIDTRIMWPCIDQQPVYQKHPIKKIEENKNAKYFSKVCLSLPLHSGLGKKDIDEIASIIEELISTFGQGE